MRLNNIYAGTPGLIEHSLNVFNTVIKVIEYLPDGLITTQQVADMLAAAIYHDIGKSTWCNDWFQKPRHSIRNADWTVMQTHPIQTINILNQIGISLSEGAKRIILQHHELPGGQGYPYGIEPDFISVIFSACDVYCACLENRAYRPYPLSIEQVLIEIKKFAPGIVADALSYVYRQTA